MKKKKKRNYFLATKLKHSNKKEGYTVVLSTLKKLKTTNISIKIICICNLYVLVIYWTNKPIMKMWNHEKKYNKMWENNNLVVIYFSI